MLYEYVSDYDILLVVKSKEHGASNRAYFDARYKPDYSITREDLEYLGARVARLRTVTEEACRGKIESLGG